MKKPATPRSLVKDPGKSKDGVSPSGFKLAEFMTPEQFAPLARKPRFLQVLQASEAPCSTCHGECCKARVIMNIPDLIRLAAPLQVHPSSLCDLTEVESRHGEPVNIGEAHKHIVLRKRDDNFCALLLDVDGHRRCGVHSLRPSICRIYPFGYERGQVSYSIGAYICPTPWIVSTDRRNQILDDVERYEQDRALDRRLVRRFNALPDQERTVNAFWDFAMRQGASELDYDIRYITDRPRELLGKRLW